MGTEMLKIKTSCTPYEYLSSLFVQLLWNSKRGTDQRTLQTGEWVTSAIQYFKGDGSGCRLRIRTLAKKSQSPFRHFPCPWNKYQIGPTILKLSIWRTLVIKLMRIKSNKNRQHLCCLSILRTEYTATTFPVYRAYRLQSKISSKVQKGTDYED